MNARAFRQNISRKFGGILKKTAPLIFSVFITTMGRIPQKAEGNST
jgi:hypothetical protein